MRTLLHEIQQLAPIDDRDANATATAQLFRPDALAIRQLLVHSQRRQLQAAASSPTWMADLTNVSPWIARALETAVKEGRAVEEWSAVADEDQVLAYASVGVTTVKAQTLRVMRALWSALAERLPTWTIAVADGTRPLLALLMDEQVCIGSVANMPGDTVETQRDPTADPMFDWLASLPIRLDPLPRWRRLAWSPDGRYVAVAYSDGSVEVMLADPRAVARQERFIIRGEHDHSYARLTRAMAPYAALLFVDPTATGRSTMDGHRYDYELLTVTHSGMIRSYLLRSNTDDSDTEQMLEIDRKQRVPGNCITVHHQVTIAKVMPVVTNVVLDRDHNVLLIGGMTNNEVSAPITRWRLVPAPPFYSLDGNDTTRDIVDPAVVIDSSTLSSSTPFASSSSSWSSMLNSIIRLTFPKAKEKDDLAGITASMDMSPDGLHIACVLFSGEVVVWNADKGPPTFENVKQRWTCTDLDTLFSDDAMTHAKVASVTWWTNESLAIALSDGRFTVVTIAVSADQQPLIDVVDEFGPGVIILRHVDKLLLLNSTIETFIVRRRKDGFVQWRAADSTVEKNGVDCTGTTSTTVIATNRPSLGTTLNLAWSIVLRPVRLITDTFLWNFDNDAERNWLPDITVHARSFTLSLMRETKPKELLLHRVRLRQFDEALELASEFSLDTDVIYKALWLESVITDESIRLYLDLVKDRYWKLEHCLLRIAKSHVEQRLLYEYGLELTNILPQLLVQSSPGGRAHSPDGSWDARLQGVLIDDDKKETLITRLQFLRLIDRLTTFEVIYDEALFQLDFPFQHRFTSFRDVDLVDQAMEYARDADISALRALIDTEYATLYAFRFAILESMCEVVAPEEYRVLLPGASSERRETWVTARPSRVADWVECSVIRRQLQLQAEDKGIFVKTVHLSTDQAVEHPVDNSFLVDWYVRRAIALEESTGMVDHALELVTIAREKGVVNLDRVQERISRIVRFVYDPVAAEIPPSATLDNAFIRGALDNDNGFLMDLFLRRSSGLELHSKSYLVSNDISVHLLPLVDSVDAASHLMDVIHKRSLKDMRWCSLFVQCVQGRPSGVAVYLDDKQLVLFVHRCISCTNRADQWKEIAQLLKIVQRFHQSSARITDTWNDYVVAAELLDRQNIHLTPKQLEDIQQNPTAQHQLITKLARIPLVSHGESSMGEDTVQLLLDAMLRLQKTLCSAVESAEIYERFIAGLLTCGHSSFFGFVRDLLFPEPSTAENRAKSPRSPVDPTKAKSIILNAAREYMEIAESANATDPLFKLALECLDVVPVSAISANADLVEAVKNERKFADAIGELCSLSSDLLPIQVLHHSSPIDLIREVIRSSPTLYADTSKVVSLASKLIRVPKLDHIGQISLLSEMVDSAIGHADSHRAYSICLDLVTMVRESREKKRGTTLPSDAMDIVCSSCYQVAREQQFGDSAKRRKLLGYALSFMCTGVGRYACNKSGKVVTSSTILQVWKEMEEVEIAVAIEDQLGIHAKSRVSTVTDKIRDFIRPASVLVDCSAAHRLPRDIFMTGLSPRTPVDSQVIRRRNCQLIGSVFDDDRGCLALLPLSKVWATMRTPASTALLCRAFVEDDFLVGMASAVVDETRDPVLDELAKVNPAIHAQIGCFITAVVKLSKHLAWPTYEHHPLFTQPAARCIERAAKDDVDSELGNFRKLVKQQHQQTVLATVYQDANIDASRFQDDSTYRKQVVFNLACSRDEQRLKRALILAKSNLIDEAEVLMCHLDYVQKATLNDFGAWKHAVDSLADMMEPFAARINAAVCTQMKEGLADAQLRGYYYLMTKLSIWTGDDCEQLKIRLEILDMCSRFKSSLSLRKLLLMRYSCSEDGHAKDVAAIIASGPEFIRFHGSLSELLSRIDRLRILTQIPAEQQLATLIANVYSGQAIHDIRDAARIPSASQVVRFYFENELSSVLSSPAEFAQTLLHQLTVEDRMEASECIALAARIGKLVVDALLQPCEHRILLDFGAAALGLLMKQIKVVPSEVARHLDLFHNLQVLIRDSIHRSWFEKNVSAIVSAWRCSDEELEHFLVPFITDGTPASIILALYKLHAGGPPSIETIYETALRQLPDDNDTMSAMLERICIASVVSLQVIDFPTIVQSAFSQVPRDRKRLALIVVGRHFSLGTDATATLKGMELRGLVDRIFGAGFKVDAEKLLTVSSAGEDIVTLIGAIATVEQALLVNLVLARMTVAGRLSDEDERHLASWWTAFKEACSSVAGSSNAMWNLLVDCQLMRFDVYSEDEEAKSVLIQRMRGALDILASDPVTNLSSLGLLGHLLVLKHLHQTPNNHASTSMAQAYLGIPTILHTLSVHLRVIPLAIARIRALLNSDGVRAKFMTNRAFIDSIEGVLNGTTPFEPWLVEVMDRLGVAALLDRACELYPGAGEDFTTGDV